MRSREFRNSLDFAVTGSGNLFDACLLVAPPRRLVSAKLGLKNLKGVTRITLFRGRTRRLPWLNMGIPPMTESRYTMSERVKVFRLFPEDSLVSRRPLDVIDDENIDGSFGR